MEVLEEEDVLVHARVLGVPVLVQEVEDKNGTRRI